MAGANKVIWNNKEGNPMNFFNWIRDGVRDAVLLGVSDAVKGIGTPPNGDDVSQRLLEVVRRGSPEGPTGDLVALQPRRKKLGRSLGDIRSGAEKPT